ncbi:MAG: hypothetical protein C0485_10230 [Pirellula sp.]|nr:hypothetical protein [Pirellula sp.]
MARDAHDREDLLRDARGLSPRVQLEVTTANGVSELFAGFRGESLSLYFGQDLVFHFNDGGQLRRAYVADQLLKADQGRLIAMRRDRSPTEVSLVSRLLEPGSERSLLVDLEGRLRELADAFAGEAYHVVGEVPADGGAVDRLRAWLTARRGPIELAASPRVG